MQGYNSPYSSSAWNSNGDVGSGGGAAWANAASLPHSHQQHLHQQQLRPPLHPELDPTSDEFRMFCFKIVPCSIKSTHPWDSCVFSHPHENARRRDPRTHAYVPEPCPDYRHAGLCLLGNACPFSHGVYERHLHPSRYRTRPCAEGASCSRRVCFFAHGASELRAPTHDRMTPSDAEAIRRTRLAAIATDAAQPLSVREQAAALYEGKTPPLPSPCGGAGGEPRPRSLFDGGSGDFSPSTSRGGGGVASVPHSGPGTPLSTTSMGGGGGGSGNGGAARGRGGRVSSGGSGAGLSPFAPPDFGDKAAAANSSSMLLHQLSAPTRFGPGAAAMASAAAAGGATQPSSAVSTPTATSVAAAALHSTNSSSAAAAAAIEGPRMSMAVRRQLGMAPPSRTDSGVGSGGGSGFGTPRNNHGGTATAPGSPCAGAALAGRMSSNSVSSAAAAAAVVAAAAGSLHRHQQQMDASAAATAALLLSARPAGLRPVATSMPPNNSNPCSSSSSSHSQQQQQQLPRGVGSSGSGGSDTSCGLVEAFSGSGSGSGSTRMSSGCGGGASAAAAAGVKSLPPRAPASASQQHLALRNVPVGRAGPSGDLGEAVARLGVRFSFMGDGGSE